VEHLEKDFGELKAVHDVSFKINRDEIVGLIGPNGAGKTTLTRLIMGLIKPNAGRILFKNIDITGWPTHKIVNLGMTTTFQVVKPFRNLPVIANVLVSALSPRSKKAGDWIKTAEVRARDALEFCGISDLAAEPASVLSHGDLKRLEIARAIATEPELLILDEPLGGLNPAETSLIVKSIKRLHKGGRFGRLHSEGPAMLIIEHKLDALMQIADRIVVMDLGEVIAVGSSEEIMNNKRVLDAYIGMEVNELAS